MKKRFLVIVIPPIWSAIAWFYYGREVSGPVSPMGTPMQYLSIAVFLIGCPISLITLIVHLVKKSKIKK